MIFSDSNFSDKNISSCIENAWWAAGEVETATGWRSVYDIAIGMRQLMVKCELYPDAAEAIDTCEFLAAIAMHRAHEYQQIKRATRPTL